MAWSDEPWILDGAAVRISIAGFDDGHESHRLLNGAPVAAINPDLTSETDITGACRLEENAGIGFQGDTKGGAFEISGELARAWLRLPLNPNSRPNSDVVRQWITGFDVTRRRQDMWIVDFGVDMPEKDASLYETPFEYVRQKVKPVRANNVVSRYAMLWWIHRRPRGTPSIACSFG